MTRPSVYLETSVVSYACSRPSRNLISAARQSLTREWFESQSKSFDLFISQVVLAEVSAGDPAEASRRLALIADCEVLEVTDASGDLAEKLVSCGAVPEHAAEDALHIALAAVNGVDFLLTWNCKHIANAVRRGAIESQCRCSGCEPPVICTPEELSDVSSA